MSDVLSHHTHVQMHVWGVYQRWMYPVYMYPTCIRCGPTCKYDPTMGFIWSDYLQSIGPFFRQNFPSIDNGTINISRFFFC